MSGSEYLVLYGLVKNPSYTGKQLASAIGLSESTVSNARRSLYEKGYYRKVVIPDFWRIGANHLTIAYCQMCTDNYGPYGIDKLVQDYPEITHIGCGDGKRVAIWVQRDYAEFCILEDSVCLKCSFNEALGDEGPKYWHFPLRISSFLNFFEYEAPIRIHFGIPKIDGFDYDKEITPLSPGKRSKQIQLGKRYAQVLYALVKYPEDTDSGIAEKLGMHRTTVSRYREKFEQEDLIHTRIIPNLNRLGIKSRIVVHGNLKKSTTYKEKKELLLNLRENMPLTLFVYKKSEAFAVLAYPDSNIARRIVNTPLDLDIPHGILESPPTIFGFYEGSYYHPKWHEYAPITKKLLDLK